ncbi:MAG: lipopolysaccharide transport periplasmic protein LptA [Deltaproteobacteria bacterium]|nr:lipopolysaccharide transport periplasmic protein LptA [Deltaproteobacteria bacterium]
MKIRTVLIGFLFLGLIVYPKSVVAEDFSLSETKAIENDTHVEITSDRLDAYHEKRLVVFSGNAVATQGDIMIKADKILIYYKKNQEDPESEGSTGKKHGVDFEKIEAKGHVTVIQGDRVVSGDDAVYDDDAKKIAMTGNAVMREGNNIIHGETIVVYFKENRGVVEGAENKRVKATIYPEKMEEE